VCHGSAQAAPRVLLRRGRGCATPRAVGRWHIDRFL
jgi:hypothetical protein